MASSDLSPEDVSAQIERICASPGFGRSPRLKRFLRYLVDERAAGRTRGLKEYAIGVEVFDRGEGFDPRLDPIVRVEARRLRTRLADYYASHGANDPIRIEVPTGAYEPILRRAFAPVPPTSGSSRDPTATTSPVAASRPRRRLALAVPVVFVLALLLGGGLRWLARARPTAAALSSAAAPREPLSIAVLPLAPIGDDPLVAAFSDGLTEDIITQLARVRGLRVIARTSVNRFKGTQMSVRLVAKDLGVATILEGSVRRDGGLIRITAQLIDGPSERHLWAESYDRTYANTLAIQGEIAREVTRALSLHLSPQEQRRLLASNTTSPAAHEAYLRGVHHMSLRTPAEVQKGVAWLEKAVSLDARYGAARATLGETYLFLALEGAGAPSQLMEKTRDLGLGALAVDPDLAEGHRALGLVHAFLDRDWLSAERELRAAVELDPGLLPNHEALATCLLLPLGRTDEAVAEERVACSLSPLSASAIATLGRLVDLAGDEAEGIRLLNSAIDLEPRYARAYVQLAKLHLSHDRAADAVPLLERAASLAPDATTWRGALAVAHARLGHRAEVESIARQLAEREAAGLPSAVPRAEVAMALGRTDEAFGWLERAADGHEPWVIFLGVDPIYEPLRPDPRFERLLRRLGLAKRGS